MVTMFKTYRTSDLDRKLNIIGINPLDIMVTGVTGSGKSTTLNSIFQKEVATVGKGVDPETMTLTSYSLNHSFRLWDTPGLGDGIEARS
ncbi:MAG: GTPase [Ghiorsea sp.]|nr:GTPase [Ghiorsea sp.]